MRKPPSRWRGILAAAILLLARGVPAQAADVPPPAPAAVSAGERTTDAAALDPNGLLLFSVTLDDLTLSEGLGAYGAPEDPLVPFGELARLLEADIDVFPPEQRIVGRLGPARRALLVDIRSGLARVSAQDIRLSPQDYVVTPTEIYLRVSLIQKLLSAKIDVATDELALHIRASEKFPVQARLQRMANRPEAARALTGDEQTLKVDQPYAFLSPPGFDIVLDGGLESARRQRDLRYDLRFAGDFLWTNVQGYLGSDEVGRPANARLMFQRRSLEGNLLGPLHAREISAGDVYTPGLAMGPRSVSGRGVSISTVPLEQTNVFNRIDLRGELPPGFDVELYVNDVLRGSTNQAVNGRFEFLAIPLSPGVNVLRVVTYGPRGERNEEVTIVNAGANLLRPGEAQFAFGVVDQDQPLIRLRNLDGLSLGDSTLFASSGVRTVASLNYGVTSLLSVSAGLASVPRPLGGRMGVYTAGARTSLLGLATQLDGAWDSRGGAGVTLGLAGQLADISGVLRHAEYRDGFVDENNLGFNSRLRMVRRTELTLDSNLDLRGRIVPVSMRAIANDYAAGSHDLLLGARASTSLGSILYSAGWEYQRLTYRPASTAQTLTGYIAASTYRSYRWQVRTTLDYQLEPTVKAKFLSVTVDHRLTDAWSWRFGVGQPLDKLSGWNVILSSILATRYGDLSLTGQYDHTDHDLRVAAQWSFGLGWDPARRAYDLTRTGPGSGGSLLLDAFMDRNGDGIRQPDEVGAANVMLEGGPKRGLVTGPDGRLLVTGLGAGPTAHMDVNLDRLDNPAVATPPTRLDLRPRPGAVARVAFPMRPTGGVTVKVELLRDDGQRVGLASVRLQLVPDKGAPVEGVTEFDGTAVFDQVPMGAYRIQLEPKQAARLRMRLVQEPTVVIKGDGADAPDVALQVRFEAPPAPAGSK